MDWPGIEAIKKRIIHGREQINISNPFRTIYYLAYWKRNPEVLWSLLAHLVSCNAGYQMSDLVRFRGFLVGVYCEGEYRSIPASQLPPQLSQGIIPTEINAIFALLETGNFLIFRDVYPQLEAYAFAKQFPEHSNALFNKLMDQEFRVDEFIITEWKRFFAEGWGANQSPSITTVRRQSFALIVNEQNQIEDRLVNDSANRYLKPFGAIIGPRRAIDIADSLNWTKLAFPIAESVDNPMPNLLLLYTVRDFLNIDKRIQTGRDLYFGLFEKDEITRNRLLAWITSAPRHHATRRDYNPGGFSIDPASLFPGGKKYSPPMLPFGSDKPAWPLTPAVPGSIFRHLHDEPIPLPVSIGTRYPSGVENLLGPVTPEQELVPAPLEDLDEIPF